MSFNSNIWIYIPIKKKDIDNVSPIDDLLNGNRYNIDLVNYLRRLKNNGKDIILISGNSKCLDVVRHLIRLGILELISDVYSFYEGSNSVSEFLRNSVRYVPDISKCLWLESSYIDMDKF